MTTKHLDDLAEVIAEESSKTVRIRFAAKIGKIAAKHNKQFDQDKWDNACNVNFIIKE
jgi:hypothetical protein